MNKTIDAVIIDTSALLRTQCDFLGINSALLPSFYNLLSQKGVMLLDSDILHREVLNHLHESSIVKTINELENALKKSSKILSALNVPVESIRHQFETANVLDKLIKQYETIYSNAHKLPYPDSQKVFDLYFSSTSPFRETVKKKNEFPDAFIIESVKDFLKHEPYKIVLAISQDSDWETAFENNENVICIDSFDKAINLLQDESDLADVVFEALNKNISDEILFLADCECYELEEYELVDDDIEITEMRLLDLDSMPVLLKLDKDSVVLKVTAKLAFNGRAKIFDDDNSVWDSIEREYIFKVYSDIEFVGATTEIECEVEIKFDLNDIKDSAEITSAKITTGNPILISLNGANVSYYRKYEEN